MAFACVLFMVGCVMPAEKKQMRDDIFSLQTRLLEMETQQKQKTGEFKSSEENANQRIASGNVKVEQLQQELQRLKGEMDGLKVGVKTGKIPGDNSTEPSLSDRIDEFSAHLDELEATQAELLEAVKALESSKSKKSQKPQKSQSSKGAEGATLSKVRTAFNKKDYKYVIDNGEQVLAKEKSGKQKEEIIYFQAESLFHENKLRDAALKYNDLLDIKPTKDRVAHAKMRLGDCFRQLGDNATAKLYYEELVSQFPDKPEGRKAKERLQKM